MPEYGKSCPFADLCADNGFFHRTGVCSHSVSHDPVEVALVAFDDHFGDGLTPFRPADLPEPRFPCRLIVGRIAAPFNARDDGLRRRWSR